MFNNVQCKLQTKVFLNNKTEKVHCSCYQLKNQYKHFCLPHKYPMYITFVMKVQHHWTGSVNIALLAVY